MNSPIGVVNETVLNRQFGKRFGDDAYAAEELVAEIGSAFLCGALGIEGHLQHPEYVANWLSVLKGDKRGNFHRRIESNTSGGLCAWYSKR